MRKFFAKFFEDMVLVPAFVVMTFLVGYAMADQSVVSPGDFLAEVLKMISAFGGLSWVMKVSSIITLILSSMKVSFLNDLWWSKLGQFKAWAAPILGMVLGAMTMLANGQSITLASLLAYFSAGAGALILHELLDTIKAIPGLGPVWVSLINAIKKALGGPTSVETVPFKP
jgi:hypothetical protein